MIVANPYYVHVLFNNDREDTVSVRDLALIGEGSDTSKEGSNG